MANNPDFAARTYAKVDWHVVPFLFLCYILAYLDRVNVGFAKLTMQKDLALSDAAFATGAGIFFLGYFFFEVPSNIALKKFGARMWIMRIMVTWGVVSSATMFVTGEWAFYAMRILLGVAEAGFFPGIIFYLTLWYPSDRRSTRTAWFVTGIPVAGVLGNPVSGAIMDLFGGSLGMAGWQWLFLIEGIPSIIVGVLVMYYLDSSIDEAKWLTAEEKALLNANLNAEERRKSEASLLDAFKSLKVYALSAIYFTLMIGLYGIAFWLPTIVKGFGIQGYWNVGLLSAIPWGVATIGMLIISHHSDQTGERRWHYALNVTAGAIGLALSGAFGSNPVLSIIFLSIGTYGVVGSMPLFWPIPSAFLTGTAAAAGIGIVNSVGNLGGWVGGYVPVWVKEFTSDPAAAMYTIAVVLVIGGLITLVTIPSSLRVRVGVKDDGGSGRPLATPAE